MACIFCRFLAWLQRKLDDRALYKAARARNLALIRDSTRSERLDRIRNTQYELPPNTSTSMACIYGRLPAWLQRKLDDRALYKAARARDLALIRDSIRSERIDRIRNTSPRRKQYELPPIPPRETLETLRARIPPRSRIVDEHDVFLPPGPTDTVEETCRYAAEAVQYPLWAATTEPERELVAARTVQAVATAISTSPTYPVHVAVFTMAESLALIMSEERYTDPPPGIVARRRLDALNAAVEAGMSVYADENASPPDGDDDSDFDFQAFLEENSYCHSTLIHN